MRAFRAFRVLPAALVLASIAVASRADANVGPSWEQYQGNAAHTGSASLAPAPPYRVAWQAATGIGDESHVMGLPAPVIAGSVAVVEGRQDVTAIDLVSGQQAWTLPRALGPSAPVAFAGGPGPDTIIYTEGGGDRSASASRTPTPSPTPSSSASPGAASLTTTSRLVAIDAESRAELWHVNLPAVTLTGATIDGGLAVVGTDDGTVTAVDIASGKKRWSADVGDHIDTPLAAAAGLVFAVARSESRQPPTVIALHEADGSEAWRYTPRTSALVAGAPSVSGSTVYVALTDASVRAVATDTGSERWAERLNTFVPGAPPAVSSDAVVVADQRGQVYRLDPTTGAVMWDFAINTTVYGPAVIAGDAVVVPTGSGELFAFDMTSGDEIWRLSLGVGPLLAIAYSDALVVSRTGPSAGVVALVHDPAGTLVRVESPTILKPALLLGWWAAAAMPLVALLLVFGRFIGGRLEPLELAGAGEDEEDVRGEEDDP